MSKRTVYVVVGLIAVIVAAAAACLVVLSRPGPSAEGILAAYQDDAQYSKLTIDYPLDETLFPPEIASPTFRWTDADTKSDTWLITIEFQDDPGRTNWLVRERQWAPETAVWETMKSHSLEKDAKVTVIGVNHWRPSRILSAGRVCIKTSKDEVGAPIFYREVNLPFIDAVKDPSQIRWRFGAVSSAGQPPVVMKGLPVCGNCHSFPRDAGTLAMDVDYANSKGSYVITKVAEQMVLASSDIITWNDYKKEDGEQTFGLLSQISPDGRFVVSTVKDKSVFVPMPGIAFSQLFFPIKGILCVYDRQTGTFKSLPGADDPKFVQSNPTWSPDGKYIVFARSEAYDLKDTKGKGKVLLTREECREFTEDGKPFLFDLYRIPFNNGDGGKPEPIEGASNNGVSNYFARYSPNGKWIVFCRAKSYMLLQPDSELYIIPAEGGQAKRLRGNTRRMNSWHSWSPNGKWLVFSSKAYSDYTQLFLTHIDEEGSSTPAVLLSNFTSPDRAANIPEFVNAESSAIKTISEQFLDDYSFVRAGNEFFRGGDTDNAIEEYSNALELNPDNAEAHRKLGFLLYNAKAAHAEGMAHYSRAMQLDPNDPRIHHDVGMALLHQRRFKEAIVHLSRALSGMPQGLGEQYNLSSMHRSLGQALLYSGNPQQAAVHLSKAVQLDPNNAPIHYILATALAAQGDINQTLVHYSRAVSLKPQIDTSPTLHHLMATNYAEARQFGNAVLSAEKTLNLANAAGDEPLARQIRKELELYRQLSRSLSQSDSK